MIYKLVVRDPAKAALKWFSQVEFLKDKTELEFKPGLNVLYGHNGSGKSTLLSSIAHTLCCHEIGRQVVTKNGILSWSDFTFEAGWVSRFGVYPEHDGSPVMYYDPSREVGVRHGRIQDDFSREGVLDALFRGSAGETNWMRIHEVMGVLMGDHSCPPIDWRIPKDLRPNLETFLQGDGKPVCPTILLDEPSSNMDIPTEMGFYELLYQAATKRGIQVIVATHSPFALNFKGANYIDTTPNASADALLRVEYYFLSLMLRDPARFEHVKSLIEKYGADAFKVTPPRKKRARKPKG